MAAEHIDGALIPTGSEYLTTTELSSSVGLTIPGGNTKMAFIQAEGAAVRWNGLSTDTPTASVGQLLAAGLDMWYTGDLSEIRFIETTTASKLNVQYYSG